jgi:hypothetical protein
MDGAMLGVDDGLAIMPLGIFVSAYLKKQLNRKRSSIPLVPGL